MTRGGGGIVGVVCGWGGGVGSSMLRYETDPKKTKSGVDFQEEVIVTREVIWGDLRGLTPMGVEILRPGRQTDRCTKGNIDGLT